MPDIPLQFPWQVAAGGYRWVESHPLPESRQGRRPFLTFPLWERIRDSSEPFEGVFAWNNGQFDLSSGGESRCRRRASTRCT